MTPILIFQSISSFNPNLREINSFEKKLPIHCLEPQIAGRLEKMGSANRPKMDKFENFSTISCSKSKLKGGQFNEKKCQLLYFGPHIVGRFGHIWGSANRPTIDRFEKFF